MTTAQNDNDGVRLYYMPGTCALAVHIALEWSGADYSAKAMEYEALSSPDYRALNPSGVVPTLTIDADVLTEASAILLSLARRYPSLGPGDDADEKMRFEFERFVIYMGGTLHPHFWPWFAPARYGADDADASDKVKAAAETMIARDFTWLNEQLKTGPYLGGKRRTVADAYLFPMARWGYQLKHSTANYPNLDRFMHTMVSDASVQAAMKAQGLPPLFEQT